MKAARLMRGAASVALFGVFGAGALLISPLMAVLWSAELRQPVVRAAWRAALFLFCATGLIRVKGDVLRGLRGSVIAANHPSLIDVVIIVALAPRTMYVAKHSLMWNLALGAIVRATALPDDARLPEAAAGYLAKGWNVLIFPEGTRSRADGGLQPLRRGAAQLALRTGAPLECVRVEVTRRILGKGQAPWDMGDARVEYGFSAERVEAARREGETMRGAAVRVTGRMREILGGGVV